MEVYLTPTMLIALGAFGCISVEAIVVVVAALVMQARKRRTTRGGFSDRN